MMVQELMPLGSLQNYLLNNSDKIRPSFELKVWASQIACGKCVIDNCEEENINNSYDYRYELFGVTKFCAS